MIRGSISRRTVSGTIAEPSLEIIAASDENITLWEMEIILATAVASVYGLGRPAAKGVNPTTPVAILPEGLGDPSEFETLTAVAWTTTKPTVPAQFFRRISLAGNIGAYIRWNFEKGIFIPKGQSLVLWNITANGISDVSIVVDE